MMRKTTLYWIIALVVLVAGIAITFKVSAAPGKYDSFTECLSTNGATFYGAFWCSHCSDQKELFGKSAKYLPYVECSTSDRRSKLPVCEDAGIEGYPTWKFADGTEQSGLMTLKQLAAKTDCELPT